MRFSKLYKLESRSRFFTKKPYISCFYFKILLFYRSITIKNMLWKYYRAFTPQITEYIAFQTGLISFAPIWFNITDMVSNTGLGYTSCTSGYDRFDSYLSSLWVNVGYVTFPSGVYFNGDFTVSIWVKPLTLSANCMRIFDFGNGAGFDNVFLTLTNGTLNGFNIIFHSKTIFCQPQHFRSRF